MTAARRRRRPAPTRAARLVAGLGVRGRLGRLVRAVRRAGPRPARHRLERRGDGAGPDRRWPRVALTPFGARRAARPVGAAAPQRSACSLVYGAVAVAGAQFCYFSAVQHMQVGPALLIEYTAPAAVVVWLWLRHGQRPGRLTLVGAGLAALGLVLVLDLLSGADLSVRRRAVGAGARWSAARRTSSSPPTRTTACRRWSWPGAGWSSARWRSGCSALVGRAADATRRPTPRRYAGAHGRLVGARWWCWAWSPPRFAYVAGIAAGRRLGSRLASFVALLEVVASVVLGLAAARRAARRRPAARRAADPGRRRRGQAGRAVRGGPAARCQPDDYSRSVYGGPGARWATRCDTAHGQPAP